MCKLKAHGKRCPVTSHRKEVESYRQKVKYQAKKEGTTSQEWLKSDEGQKFATAHDPRIVNPNWHQEHQEQLALIKNGHPQVTMSNNFLATTNDLSIIKANFPERDQVRGEDEIALSTIGEYKKIIAKKTKKFSMHESNGLKTYSTGKYREINRLLRDIDPNMTEEEYKETFYKNIKDPKEFDDRQRKTIENIDSALSHRRESAEITYRCMTSDDTIGQTLEKYKPNSVISFDSYTSTSHSPLIAANFSDHILDSDDDGELNFDKKNKTLDYTVDDYSVVNHSIMFEVQSNAGQPIALHSIISEEKEILMPRGLHFKVVESYATTEQNPYKIKQSGHNFKGTDGYVGQVKDKFVVVQLVECDKDGNIISPNDQTRHIPPKLPVMLNEDTNTPPTVLKNDKNTPWTPLVLDDKDIVLKGYKNIPPKSPTALNLKDYKNIPPKSPTLLVKDKK